jgi:hypothetical protein
MRRAAVGKKETALAVVKETPVELVQESNIPATVDAGALIARAIDKNLPIESMEKLLAMRRELKAEWAKEQYFAALSRFQKACPTIGKSKGVNDKYGKRRYSYAPLEVIVEEVRDALEANGFSYTTATEQTPDSVTAICNAHHIAGHGESTRLTVPIDHEAYMSAPQKVASALTYATRYAFRNAFGIMTGDEDDDAQSAWEPGPTKPMKEPKAVDAEFKPEPTKQEPAKPIIEVAREALSMLYKTMRGSNLFTEEELAGYKKAGVESRDNLNSLTDLHAAWTNEMKERGKK